MTEVKLDNANLSEADLEASIWTEDEINKFHLQLVDAKFTYIIEVQEKKKIYREDLFAQLISG